MKEFIAQYLLSLWIYGSQALLIYFGVRRIVQTRAADKAKARALYEKQNQTNPLVSDLRRERNTNLAG